MTFIHNLFRGRYVLMAMAKHDFKNKYRNSVLGVGWAFLSPLGMVAIIGTVYSILFRMSAAEFIPYLFLGIMPWNFLTESAAIGSRAFLNSHGYIKQTVVPLEVFPARVTVSTFLNFLFSLTVFVLLYFIRMPQKIGWSMLLAVPAMILWLIFVLGYTSITALTTTYIRDFEPIQTLMLQALFYATPVLYRSDMIPQKYAWIYRLNPLYYLLEILRTPLLGEGVPAAGTWMAAIATAGCSLALAQYLLLRIGRKIAFKL